MEKLLRLEEWSLGKGWISLALVVFVVGCGGANDLGPAVDALITANEFDPLVGYGVAFIGGFIALVAALLRKRPEIRGYLGLVWLVFTGVFVWLLEEPALLTWVLGALSLLVAWVSFKGGGHADY